jgi:hypothetical protein
MAKFDNPLDQVRVAAPCKADWEQMIGNERSRFCGQCNLNVYNLSSMTKSEAEHLIASNEGQLCARFYRRRDGSILTENCPVGLRALKRKFSYARKAITSAVLTFFAGLGVHTALSSMVPFTTQGNMGTMVSREVKQPELVTPVVAEYPPNPPTTGKMVFIKRKAR